MKNKKIIILLWLSIPLVGGLIFYAYLIPGITNAYQNNPDNFIQFIIDHFYPRFWVEKNRFDITFFIAKANQVYARFTFLYLLTLVLIYSSKTEFVKKILQPILYQKTNTTTIQRYQIIISIYFFYVQLEILQALVDLQNLSSFYKPVLILKQLNLPFPSETAVYLLGSIWLLSNTLVLLRIYSFGSSILSIILFIFFQANIFSFEKLDHGYVILTYALLLFPFLLLEAKTKEKDFNSWALALIRFSIAVPYALSGLEKIFISGISWLNPENLRAYLLMHPTSFTEILCQSDALLILISITTLLFQLSFICLLFLPNYKWYWLLGGVVFHTATLCIMNIGHPLNPWIMTYLFFIEFDNPRWNYFFKRFNFFSKN